MDEEPGRWWTRTHGTFLPGAVFVCHGELTPTRFTGKEQPPSRPCSRPLFTSAGAILLLDKFPHAPHLLVEDSAVEIGPVERRIATLVKEPANLELALARKGPANLRDEIAFLSRRSHAESWRLTRIVQP